MSSSTSTPSSSPTSLRPPHLKTLTPTPSPHPPTSSTQQFFQSYLPPSLSPTLSSLHSHAKSWLYFSLTTGLLILALSNSFTRLFKSIWSDVGNNWACIWAFILSFNFSPATLYIVGSSLLHFTLYWLYSLTLTYFDVQATPHLISRYKIQPYKNIPVPRASILPCILQVLSNQLLIAVPTFALTYPLAVYRGTSTTLPLPSFERFCCDMAVCLLVEELLFYYLHRLLHHPALYGRIHKRHHEWTAPIAIATNYCSGMEHLLSNLIPALAGPLICGSHLSVIWVWQAIATLTSVNTHSGYHLPFMPSPEAHDFHHLRFNVNYGVLGLLDWLHGTDVPFRGSAQYAWHKTTFSLTGYEPGLAAMRRRLGMGGGGGVGKGEEKGGVAVVGKWGEKELEGRKEGKEEEVKEEEEGLGLGLGRVRGDSEL